MKLEVAIVVVLVASCSQPGPHAPDLGVPPDDLARGANSDAGSDDDAATHSLFIQPSSYVVPIGRSQIFVASGSGSATVTWSVTEAGGGAVDSSGNYTAPSTPGTYHVVTTAGGLSGSATVTVADFQLSLLAGKLGGYGHLDGVGPAARLAQPYGLVGDGSGNLYFTDQSYTIRKFVVATGAVTTIAGSGQQGYVDATGVNAQFDTPTGLALDRTNGVLYVCETDKETIRQIVLSTGVVSTLVGTPGAAPGSTDGIGAAAQFYNPKGLRYDGTGALYVADWNNGLIRRVDVASKQVTTVAGNGSGTTSDNANGKLAGINGPLGLVIYNGVLYIASSVDSTIRTMSLSGTNTVGTLSGTSGMSGYMDLTGAAARFNYPSSINADGSGTLYVADTGNNAIRSIDIATQQVGTLAGQAAAGALDGTGAAAQFNEPEGLAIDSASLYVADNQNATLRSVTLPGAMTATVAGASPSLGSVNGAFSATTLAQPGNLAYDGIDKLYVAEFQGADLRVLSLGSKISAPLAGTPGMSGATDGTGTSALFGTPYGIAFDSVGGQLYATDITDDVVRVVTTPAGTVTTPYGDITTHVPGYVDMTGTQARFDSPIGIIKIGSVLYVGDSGNNVIRRIDLSSAGVSTLAGNVNGTAGSVDGIGTAAQFDTPSALAWDGGNLLFVADSGNGTIRQIDLTSYQTSTLAGTVGVTGAADGIGLAATFGGSFGLAYDGAGSLYVSDYAQGIIRRVYVPTRAVSTLVGFAGAAGTRLGSVTVATLSQPIGIVMPAPETLLIADSAENSVLQLTQQ